METGVVRLATDTHPRLGCGRRVDGRWDETTVQVRVSAVVHVAWLVRTVRSSASLDARTVGWDAVLAVRVLALLA